MTLTIETAGNLHVWRTGDDLSDLRHAIILLRQYADELEEPAAVASRAAQPLEPHAP